MAATPELYCSGPECDRPAFRGSTMDRPLCEAHTKQMQRVGRLSVIKPELSPQARVLEAAEAWVEVSSIDDDEYESRRRAVINTATALGIKEILAKHKIPSVELIAQFAKAYNNTIRGMRRAKRAGVHVGRTATVSDAELRRLYRKLGSAPEVARALDMAQSGIYRRLHKLGLYGRRR